MQSLLSQALVIRKETDTELDAYLLTRFLLLKFGIILSLNDAKELLEDLKD
jgi:hypothetical protein